MLAPSIYQSPICVAWLIMTIHQVLMRWETLTLFQGPSVQDYLGTGKKGDESWVTFNACDWSVLTNPELLLVKSWSFSLMATTLHADYPMNYGHSIKPPLPLFYCHTLVLYSQSHDRKKLKQ